MLLVVRHDALPFAGIPRGGFGCVVFGFRLSTGAKYGEVPPAGIESVPAGQIEAACGTKLTRLRAMAYVVLPQEVRTVLPGLVSKSLEVVKLTSIARVIALPERLFQAREAQSVTDIPPPIVATALAYFMPLQRLVVSRLERRAIAGAAVMRALPYRSLWAAVRSSASKHLYHTDGKARMFGGTVVPFHRLCGATACLAVSRRLPCRLAPRAVRVCCAKTLA